jgi:CTP:molybdopterin cytidylyltransferase MocA
MIVTPIILAAGSSRRMGRPKALLDFHGEPCIRRVLRACEGEGVAAPVVVLGYQADAVAGALPPHTHTCLNADYGSTGPAASLQAGLALLPEDAEAFLLFPVDFPLVTAGDVQGLLERWNQVRHMRRIVVPSHSMRRGHPALFPRSLEPEFRALAPDAPLHQVLRAHTGEIEYVITDNPGVLENMDTPDDYRRCLEAAGRPA